MEAQEFDAAKAQCMLGSVTVRASAEAIGIHRNTSFRWRHRFLAMAREGRPRPLQGITAHQLAGCLPPVLAPNVLLATDGAAA